MSVKVSTLAADPVNLLMAFTGGEVLRQPVGVHGEYDSYRDQSRRDVRRLIGAGLISRKGLPADVLASVVESNGGPRLNGDELVSWYFANALVGLDCRANARNGVVSWEDRERPSDDEVDVAFAEMTSVPAPSGVTPAWAIEWQSRTVHGPKFDYLSCLIAWKFHGCEQPVTPVEAWGAKCLVKFMSRVRRHAVV